MKYLLTSIVLSLLFSKYLEEQDIVTFSEHKFNGPLICALVYAHIESAKEKFIGHYFFNDKHKVVLYVDANNLSYTITPQDTADKSIQEIDYNENGIKTKQINGLPVGNGKFIVREYMLGILDWCCIHSDFLYSRCNYDSYNNPIEIAIYDKKNATLKPTRYTIKYIYR